MGLLIQNIRMLGDRFEWQLADLEIEGETITGIHGAGTVECDDSTRFIQAEGRTLLPGLIDLHIHGGGGFDVESANTRDLDAISRWLAGQGITAWVATVSSHPQEKLKALLPQTLPDLSGAKLLGFHLEGPWLNPNVAGALNSAWFRDPDIAEFEQYPNIRRITIAPELDGALDFITAVKARASVSLGHTQATYDRALEAFDHGADSLTHLYNAMPPMKNREPGVIGAALTAGAMAELICDRKHLHPATVLAAYRLFGDQRLVLISDAMKAAGLGDGDFELGDLPVTVREQTARSADGRLAGSIISLWQAVQEAVQCGIPFPAAVRMASINPAKLIGEDRSRGSIAVGKRADLVLMGIDGQVDMTIIGGRIFGEHDIDS